MKLKIDKIKDYWAKYSLVDDTGRVLCECSLFSDENFSLVSYIKKKENCQNVIYLDSFKSREKNKGYGTALLKHIIEKNNNSVLCLFVCPQNYKYLIRFYRKFNFKILNKEYFNDVKCNMIVMIRKNY